MPPGAETSPVPSHNRLRPDDDQRVQAGWWQPIKPDPDQAIDGVETGASWPPAAKHQNLMPERNEFSFKRCCGTKPRDKDKEQQAKERSHAAMLRPPARIGIHPTLG